jgi:hypothetical protein
MALKNEIKILRILEMLYYIYKILVGDFIYVGSSKDIDERWRLHLSRCNNLESSKYKTQKLYVEMLKYGVDNCRYEFREINVLDKNEARAEEQLEYEKYELNILLNIIRPLRTDEQRRSDDRDRCHKPERKEYHNKLCKRLRDEMKLNDPESYKKYLESEKKRKAAYDAKINSDPIKRAEYLERQRQYNARRPKKNK